MGNKKLISLIIIVVILGGAGIGLWYWRSRKHAPTEPAAYAPQTSVTQEASKNIGATIFEKTREPLKDKLPETNPLKRVLKNPFE